jgi:nitroreductase
MSRRAPEAAARGASYWGSIFPAIQNLILAARSRGLGATLTTIHKFREEKVREALGLPEDFETIAMIPLGHPRGKWGRPVRAPASELTHWDRWGG